jgi:hypothetical protein
MITAATTTGIAIASESKKIILSIAVSPQADPSRLEHQLGGRTGQHREAVLEDCQPKPYPVADLLLALFH